MLITADQLLCHGFGDYVLQSDWAAQNKTKSSVPALVHVLTYGLPFLFLTMSWKALLFIVGTHFIIDRWRLARYLCWIKNFIAPRWIERGVTMIRNYPWIECTGTGYAADRPPWMAVWLLIIADNLLHVLCNGIALKYLG